MKYYTFKKYFSFASKFSFLIHLLIADFPIPVEGKPKCCFFKFSSKIQYNRVVKAQLWIYLRQVQRPTTIFVQILRLIRPMKDGTTSIAIRSLKLEMNPGNGIWQSIDVKTILQNWLKQPESNLGIEIKALNEKGRDIAVTYPGPGEEGLVSSLKSSAFLSRGISNEQKTFKAF